jgi:RNase H-like domain found in reverse transcriptase
MKLMQMIFDQLKEILTSISYLILSNPNNEFEIIMNISKNVKIIDVILIQNNHSMIYESIKLNSYQFNYSIYDKKMCMIIYILKR